MALPGTINDISYTLRQTYRTLNTFNLQGEDKLWDGKNGIKIDYNLATSNSEQNEPDYRTVNLIDYHLPTPGTVYLSAPGGGINISSPTSTNNYYSLLFVVYALKEKDNQLSPFGLLQHSSYTHFLTIKNIIHLRKELSAF